MMPSTSTSPTGKWERTNLRLPAIQNHTNDSATIAASQEYYLCLPMHMPPTLTTLDSSSSNIIADDDDDRTNENNNRTPISQHEHSIALDHVDLDLDRYLSSLPQLAPSTRQLLHHHRHHHSNNQQQQQQHKLITSTNSGRIINVLQGEMAHCTPAQADVLVSDDATTCHILGLWSCCCSSGEGEGTSSNCSNSVCDIGDSRARDVLTRTDGSKLKLATVAHNYFI